MTNINDLAAVSYNMREISKLKKSRAELEALAQLEIDRITKWLADETKGIDGDIEFRQQNIINYFNQQRAENPKFKLSTPYGKVKTRKMPLQYEIPDSKIVISQLRELNLNHCIREKHIEEVVMSEIKALPVQNGRILDITNGMYLDGIKVVEQEEKITLEVE